MKKLLRIFGIFFLLLAAAHVALNIIWGIQLRNTIRDLKAQGKLKSWDEIKPPPVPDSENACLLYHKAFDLMAEGKGGQKYQPNKNWGRVNDTNMFLVRAISRGVNNWDEKTKNDVQEIMDSVQMKKIFSLIEKGSHKTRCRYNVVYDDERGKFITPFMFVRHAAKLFYLKAQFENDGGNINQSLKTILTGLKMSGHLMDEPSNIAQVIRTACDSILLNGIQKEPHLKNASPEILKSILDELTQHTDKTSFIQSYNWGLSYIERLLQGKVNLRESFMQEGKIPFTKALYTSFLGKPVFKKDMQLLLHLGLTTQEAYTLPYYKVADKIKFSLDEKNVPGFCILTLILMPSQRAGLLRAFRYTASLDVARTALALVLYQKTRGSYPDRLENLAPDFINAIPVDTFSGKPLVYKKSGKGFILYSLGPNMKDDNGTEDAALSMDTKGDIVWKSEN